LGSAAVRLRALRFHDHPPLSAGVRQVGCLLGCHCTDRASSGREGRAVSLEALPHCSSVGSWPRMR
jgi:hypothetical protein